MIAMIVQGDNGIVIPFVAKKNKIVNLEGASVEVDIKRENDLLTKTATVVDGKNGKCEFELRTSDLTVVGPYFYQWTATFPDGKIISGKKEEFSVSDKLAGVAPVIDAGAFLDYNYDVTYDGGGF
jgi:hypothetical protein